jgi:hypothetical protein
MLGTRDDGSILFGCKLVMDDIVVICHVLHRARENNGQRPLPPLHLLDTSIILNVNSFSKYIVRRH